MTSRIPGRVGKRGTIVIPADLRRRYRLEEGTMYVAEPVPEGVLLRPAEAVPVEIYTDERKAEFLLNNSITPEGYAWAEREVRKMGLDPARIPNTLPRPSRSRR